MPVKQTSGKPRVGDGTPGPGRPKGVPNKNTKAVKEMVLEALDKAGGVKYLLGQATENPTAFLTLIGKTIPLSGDLNINHDWIEPLNMARSRALASQNAERQTVQ
jgi:hypothetical protein